MGLPGQALGAIGSCRREGEEGVRQLLTALVGVIVLVTVVGVPADACTCDRVSIRKLFRQSEAVFVGAVVSIEYDSTSGTPDVPSIATLRVSESFKGAATGDTVRVWTGGTGGMCGVDFSRAPLFLVFADSAYGGAPMYETNICRRTVPVSGRPSRLTAEFRDWRENGVPPDPPPAKTGTVFHVTPDDLRRER